MALSALVVEEWSCKLVRSWGGGQTVGDQTSHPSTCLPPIKMTSGAKRVIPLKTPPQTFPDLTHPLHTVDTL
jgi:hypothetical protein